MGDGEQWYANHRQTRLWSGAGEDAIAFTIVPQWSRFKQLAPQEGPRILVHYFGNRTAEPGAVWVDAADLGPIDPPEDPNTVAEPDGEPAAADTPPAVPDAPPAAPAPEAQWYANHRRTALWSGPDDRAQVFAWVPQWSRFKQLAPQEGPRILVHYFGNRTAEPGAVWVNAADLGPIDPPEDPNTVAEPDGEPAAAPGADWPSTDEIARIVGCDQANAATSWPCLLEALGTEEIADPATVTAAIATVGTEVGSFMPINEFGDDDYVRRVYEHRLDLGNTQPGDGALYHGRGFIQLTGRANYRRYGGRLGLPLEADPDLALRPQVAARILALYFKDREIHEAARAQDWVTVRRRVNGGLNGWQRFATLVARLAESAGTG